MTWNLRHPFSSHAVFGASCMAACAALLVLANPVLAQDVNGASLNGARTLSAGFLPDPLVIAIEPGGATAMSDMGAECSGFIYASAPDFELVLDSPTSLIGIFVSASIDTTLAINDPNGKWICNDDSPEAGGTNPGVSLENPAQGTYDIWVGTYAQSGAQATGKLLITEYAASQWAGLDINGAGNAAPADTDTRESNSYEETASAEETACLEDANQFIDAVRDFGSTIFQAEIYYACVDDELCFEGKYRPGYYYAVGEACDLLRGPFESARDSCLNFPDMDNILYPTMCGN